MKTKITELFGIEHPIIQGGMHHVGFAELAAAVSNAGGLGTITGLTQGTPEKLANEIARCKEMTDKPFAVNLTFLPSLTPPDYPGLIKEIIDAGVPVVETAGRNPAEYLPALKEAGIKVIHKCTSVRHSIKAQSIGCDAGDVWFPQPAPNDHVWRTMPNHGMTPHTSGTSLSAQARYAAGVREILECFFSGEPIREPYLIVKDGDLAGMGAHSYTKGTATDGSEEAANYKK